MADLRTTDCGTGGESSANELAVADHLRTKCRQHTPETIDALRGTLRCTACGRIGWKSRGQRKFGRPARINWAGNAWMEMFGERFAGAAK